MNKKDDGGLRLLFKSHVPPPVHWQSIESSMMGGGIPDVNYCMPEGEGWIEFKVTAGFAVTLRPEQVGWLQQRARMGGRTFVAIRRICDPGVRRDAADELWMFRIRTTEAATLKANGLKAIQPSVYQLGGPSRWDWNTVKHVLSH